MTRSTTIIIYGASGDLSARKLLPALYTLFRKERLSAFRVVGLGRTAWDDDTFRREMETALQEHGRGYDADLWARFAPNLHYVSGNFTSLDDYPQLEAKLAELEPDEEESNRLFYLAMPPRFYQDIVQCIGETKLVWESDSTGWRRVIIEKPFGHDLASAQALNDFIHGHLAEHQVYRIDHYLAKETVQNMLVFRFGNSIFEPLWNRNYIDHVQITAVETVDVGRRASYYDQAGVIRDMFQNHLLQLLSIVAMEPPASRQDISLRNEKVKALAAVYKMKPDEVAAHTIRAQYDGYRQAEGVPADSETPTFAAVRLHLNNWRWQGVPFYLRSGKALAQKLTEITIQFKSAPHMLFAQKRQVPGNTLTLTIQPDEAIHLRFEVKVPDANSHTQPVNMHFHYNDDLKSRAPDAYERLLADVFRGDASLFIRDDEVELSWRIVDPILQAWEAEAGGQKQASAIYEPGSWGPVEADAFLAEHGRAWVNGAERNQIVQP